MVCRCFWQWFVEHSHICRPGSRRPSRTDASQDWFIVRPVVATRIASREEIWAHVALAVPPRTIGNHMLAAGFGLRVPLASLPLIPWHCQAWLLWCRERVDWRVEWHPIVFSDENKFCLYASDEHTVYEEQLETKFSRETENVFILSLYYDDDGIGATPPPFLWKRQFHCEVTTNFIFILIPYYLYLHGWFTRWRKWRACGIGEAKEGLENELWCRWSNGRVGEWAVM